ncbi:hypothetical protein MMC34_008439 [Xylographa carneopallida]|nr:hypothetical protein [Xylographa carneopallida]
MDGDRLSALILLPVTLAYYALTTLFFVCYRHEHAIADRSFVLSLCRALLMPTASTLLLLHIYLPAASGRLLLLSAFLGLVPASLLLLMRTIALTLRLELAAASDEVGEAAENSPLTRRSSIDEEAPHRQSVQSQRGSSGGLVGQPRPSTSITLDSAPPLLKTERDSSGVHKDEAWVLSYRWMVEGSFLPWLFSPLLLGTIAGLLLLSMLDNFSLAPASNATIIIYSLGMFVLFAHLLLLLLCCLRHPSWNELRAEGALSVVCALLLPASLGLSLATSPSVTSSPSLADSYILVSQYLLLAFYVLTFTSSVLFPLLSSVLATAYLSSSAPMPLETFVDLIHTSEGYASFLTFLRTEFSEENLLFWKDVNALEDRRLEWEALEERRRRREEKDRDKERRLSDGVTPYTPQQPIQPSAAEPTAPIFGFGAAVNKPLLSLKMSSGLESLSAQSASTNTAQSSDSPRSQSLSRPTEPKSPSQRTARLAGSVDHVMGSSGGKAAKSARNTLQPSGASDARAPRTGGAISPRSASDNGRRVVNTEPIRSLPLPGSHTEDVLSLPSAKRVTSYSTSVSPNRKHSGNSAAASTNARPQQPSGQQQQQPGLTLHPSSIHPTLSSTQQRPQSAHMRDASLTSGSYTALMPFPSLDDLDAIDALSKLRRISWSIALREKAAKHRESRSNTANAKSPQQSIRSIAEGSAPGAAGERVRVSSMSMSPRSAASRRMSPPPVASSSMTLSLFPIAQSNPPTPTHPSPHAPHSDMASSLSPRLTTSASPALTSTQPSGTPPSPQPSHGTPHAHHSHPAALVLPSAPQSPSVVKSPFMQSIVRALQATKLTSSSRREEDERKRDEERRPLLMKELVRGACDIYDKYVVAGSVQQVNLPAVIVQQVMERMRELHPRKYDKPKLASHSSGKGRHGAGGLGGHNGMQHTLGLMRHATMHFLAGAGGAHGSKAKVHPLLAAKQAKAEDDAKTARAMEETGMLSDITLLSYPFSALFADAHHAIEQLMEKDSFKRYLQSPAYDHFSQQYDKQHAALSARGRRPTNSTAAPTLSRRGSRLAVITPRLSNKVGDIEEGSEEGNAAVGRTGGLGGRRLSDSVSLQLHVRTTPREQRSSLSLVTSSPRVAIPASPATRKPMVINTVRIMTPTANGRPASCTPSPRPGGADGAGMLPSARSMEVRRGSGLRDGTLAPGAAAATAAIVAVVGEIDGDRTISVL